MIYSNVVFWIVEKFVEDCGPTTLNAVVRKAVAAQISPSRLKQGDSSGSIDVVVEEFGF